MRTFTFTVSVDAPADYTDEEIAAFIENELSDTPGDLSNPEVLQS